MRFPLEFLHERNISVLLQMLVFEFLCILNDENFREIETISWFPPSKSPLFFSTFYLYPISFLRSYLPPFIFVIGVCPQKIFRFIVARRWVLEHFGKRIKCYSATVSSEFSCPLLAFRATYATNNFNREECSSSPFKVHHAEKLIQPNRVTIPKQLIFFIMYICDTWVVCFKWYSNTLF
jgi:hypothetical protein